MSDGEAPEIEVEPGNSSRVTRPPLTRLLTNVDSSRDHPSRRTSQWRRSTSNLARSHSLETSETNQGDHRAARPTNLNAPSARRFRSHKASSRFAPRRSSLALLRSAFELEMSPATLSLLLLL